MCDIFGSIGLLISHRLAETVFVRIIELLIFFFLLFRDCDLKILLNLKLMMEPIKCTVSDDFLL